jgi:uncharacterized membrane protein YkgB
MPGMSLQSLLLHLVCVQGNVAFLMKDVVLFAVSFYLLKQDADRASLSAASSKTARISAIA